MPKEYIAQLKQKFNKPGISSSDKVQILTLLPESWTNNKGAQIMGTSRYFMEKSRKLRNQDGILSIPKKRCKK